MKRTPTLVFEYDPSVERGVRMSQLIDELAPDDNLAADRSAVADAIRGHDRFLVTTHENPDGDALGSLLASQLALDQLGKDAVMYLGGEAPLPAEYGFMPLGYLRRRLPEDAGDRVLLAVDCANESRLGPDPEVLVSAPLVVNVDHHHDNTRFGTINLVVPDASCTGEVLRDVFRDLDVRLTPSSPRRSTSRSSPTPGGSSTATRPRRRCGSLPSSSTLGRTSIGFSRAYTKRSSSRSRLLARALERAQIYEGGRLVVSYLLRTDFHEVGAAEPYSEGIIDYLRAVEGADMAALIREPPRTPARHTA